jgi:hypothetical protein
MDTLIQSIRHCVSSLTLRRLIVTGIVFAIYTFVNMFIKYVTTLFIAFCVVYTVQDLYKHRKKYLWIINISRNTIMLIVYYALGEDSKEWCQKQLMGQKKKARCRKSVSN